MKVLLVFLEALDLMVGGGVGTPTLTLSLSIFRIWCYEI